jgi:peptidoglycan/LPS O-acetylase OafA/YrhL
LVVLGVIIYVAIFDPNKLAMTLKDAQAVILYYYNWKLVPIWRDLTSFQWMYTHLWSLSVEEQFYIVWPIFILIMLSMRIAVRTMFAVLGAGIILPAIGRALLWDPSQGQAIDLYFRTDLRFDALMWGALVAWIVHVGYRPQSPSLWRWVAIAGAFGLIGLAFFDMMNDGYAYRGGFSLVGVLSALLIAGAIWSPPQAMIIRTLSLAPLRWTGRISYGLYLWHWPVALVVASYFVDPVLKGLVILMATFAIATASFYLVERRFLLLKDRIGQPSVASPGATTVGPDGQNLTAARLDSPAPLLIYSAVDRAYAHAPSWPGATPWASD